jgi:hypothetical protein
MHAPVASIWSDRRVDLAPTGKAPPYGSAGIAVRKSANRVLQDKIGYLLKRSVGRPAHEVRRYFASFSYQAQSWKKSRRVAKVEWHPGELDPRVGFIVTNFQCSNRKQEAQANVQLMLATARADIPINSVYLARYNYGVTWRDFLRWPSREILLSRRDDYCDQEFEQARGGGGPGDVFVLLSDRPLLDEMVPGVTCSPLSWARCCRRSDPCESRIR